MFENSELAKLRTGDRVKLVRFYIDEGLRIWPSSSGEQWRVVDVRAQSFRELLVDSQTNCMDAYPEATFGVNDNETIPPGTEGTVESYTSSQVWVHWDTGHRLALGTKDVAVKIPSQEGGGA